MQAKIPRSLVGNFSEVLKEFNMYTMTNFIVADTKPRTRATTNPLILLFSQRNVVEPIFQPIFQLSAFVFKTMSDLLGAERVNEFEFFDIIGVVVEREQARDITTKGGVKTKRMAITLQDLSINCVLFGSMVDQITPHLDADCDEPLSYFDLSKLIIKEVMDFKDTLQGESPSTGIRISQHSTQSGVSAIDELKKGDAIVRSIEEVSTMKQEATVWIRASIVAINTAKKDWYYKACKGCHKKIEASVKNEFDCKYCGRKNSKVDFRYKLEVLAYDGTRIIHLLLWDGETARLSGITAKKLAKQHVGNSLYCLFESKKPTVICPGSL
ncbi:hypothetical protein PIB30_092854 [Stylosanthes scabra]|uniref:Replication factor A C-terminal domain-containing protein n=1 Tax=Stylosanthes scabra TaxID=79078 RepID=A0ABU6RVJ0_9FABA|nr:hypothetical protein [Stylosanthes scabra]